MHNRKKGKGDPEPTPPPPPLVPEEVDEPKFEDDWASSWTTGTKSKSKKDKSEDVVEVSDPPSGADILQPESVQETTNDASDPWSSFGLVGKKVMSI